ncbi:carboxymuconolactone decarboxylase [Embleya scabrispora]|uniref:Carboxymuconolactone decarboxylase n=1 Tax=Embleya scabrispora TaxID=159449 RepID=A0A1T3P6F0_9ACTN|nr:carboxymuconolactone decarboxylase family protein [Embleya scabrispora]OPC84669.1 carboxymuconolactone decarboxylase [Embleya scabrispora]
MSRLPLFHPDALDASQRELYDAITNGPRAAEPPWFALTDEAGRLAGPFNAMLVAPPLGTALQGLGAAIRYATTLSPRVRELAILAVAAHWDCAFERHAHEPIARAHGITEEQLGSLRSRFVPELDDAGEHAALRLVFALLRDGDADDDTYTDAASTLGDRMVFELTTLVGYYATLALQLRAFRIAAPAEDGPA